MSPARVIRDKEFHNPSLGRVVLHVLYDTPLMQSASAIVCDELRASFRADLDVHTVWSHFQHLADIHYSREAAEVAAQADIVILATTCEGVLPGTVARWLGSWICQHHKPDTAFCGLFLQEPQKGDLAPPLAPLLRAAAELTGREWIAGTVRRQTPSFRPLRYAPAPPGGITGLFHVPVCHGING